MRETASKSALILSPCKTWMHPSSKWYSDRAEDSDRREDGSIVHHALHMEAMGLPCSVPVRLAPRVELAKKYLNDALIPRSEKLSGEVAMGLAIDSKSAHIANVEDREYPVDNTHIYGTADIIAVLTNGHVLVADWKNGSGEGVEQQLLTLAYMASKTPEYGNRPMRISALYITDDGVIADEREVSGPELEGHIDAVIASLKASRLQQRPSLPIVGVHCTQLYCPHLAYCSATAADLDMLASSGGALPTPGMQWNDKPKSSDEAGYVATRLAAVKRSVKFFEGGIKEYVNSGNRAIWDGCEYADRGNGFRLGKIQKGSRGSGPESEGGRA